jgi:hypothetical protein
MLAGQPALIVTPMKNEGPYILEWVAHHMALGFDNFIVMTNDCDDGTDRILDRLQQLIPLQHVPNPKSLFGDRSNWHVMALRYASLFNLYKDAGWIYFTDVDEFLNVWVGNGTLDCFHQAAGGFDVVSFTSMPFGSSGVAAIDDQPVVTQFTVQSKRYGAANKGEGRRATNAIKTMFHNGIEFSVRRNHRPRRADFSRLGLRWIDGSGRLFPDEWVDGKAKDIAPEGSVDFAQFNHYAIRSAEAYLIKIDRGDAAGVPRLDAERSIGYWRIYDAQGDVDTRATLPRPDAVKLRDQFLADPILGELHAAALAHHRNRAKALRAQEDYAPILAAMGLAPGET